MDKAHIQHAIGLIQYQDLDLGEIQRALTGMVQQSTRCGHQNIHPLAQALDLRVDAHAAENDTGAHGQMATIGGHALAHLGRQFPRWGEYQGAHGAALDLDGVGLQAL